MLRLALLLTTSALIGLPTGLATWYDDGTFEEDPPWDIWAVELGDGTGSWTHFLTGGNPDDYLRNEIDFPSSQGSSGNVAIFGINEDAVWTLNPASPRPRVRFACDQLPGGLISGHRLLLRQNDLYYVSAVLDVNTSLQQWQSDEFDNMTQNDFFLVDEDDLEIHMSVHPDFSSNDDVTFGFFLYGEKITFGAVTEGTVGLDNWEVEAYYAAPSGDSPFEESRTTIFRTSNSQPARGN